METKIKQEDFIRDNNLYRHGSHIVMQVPQILSGVTYKMNITEDELYELRKTDRELYDYIEDQLTITSKAIGQVALKAAQEIERLVNNFIEVKSKNIEKEPLNSGWPCGYLNKSWDI
jgi:HAMP domain-containing protein